jgi:hypothetical protein
MSHIMAGSLDRRLAQGCSPESGVLIAARARVLVTPVERQKLAYQWTDLLAVARSRPNPRSPRTPLNREEVLAHESAVVTVLDLLVAPTPGPVRGIAILSSLLSDGSGPLYSVRRGAGLRVALDEAADLLASTVL